MTKYTVDELNEMLSNNICEVSFDKVTDATFCTMHCTTNWEWLRSEGIRDEMQWVEPSEDVVQTEDKMTVWCIERKHEGEEWKEIKHWRSFCPGALDEITIWSPTRDEDIVD